MFLAGYRSSGGDRGGARGCGGRAVEATEIASRNDKILMEKVLNNTGWTSAGAELIGMLLNRPPMSGLAFTGAHRHHHLHHLDNLVVPLV